MTRRTWITRALAALTTVAGGLAASHAGAAETIKIGEINSYTRLPAFTEPYKKGWEMAVAEINASGGVKGRLIEVISRDDAGKPANAIKIAEEMVSSDGVVMLWGTFFSHIGLAVTDFAKQREVLFMASEPLSDAIVWTKGNKYTYRLRPSTHMQAAMLAKEAAKTGAKRFATIAPNYAYGTDAVKAFKSEYEKLVPDVEWVEDQLPPLFKIDAGAVARAVEAAKPDAIYNVTFGGDLAKLVREGSLRGTFKDRTVVSLLSGEPEYLDPLGAEAPEGWIVTGYPWYAIEDEAHKTFVANYEARWGESPKTGSLVGYNSMLAIAEMFRTTTSLETKDLLAAMDTIVVDSPSGPFTFRPGDHQATMGAWVGRTAVVDGKPVMVDWYYAPGEDYLPSEAEAIAMRPAE
ncbi:MAG: ABC transporter substrate-binding protein [Pseudomonadota bacterium]